MIYTFLGGNVRMKLHVNYFVFFFFVSHSLYTIDEQSSSSGGSAADRIAMIQKCVELIISLAQKGYTFLHKEKPVYDLQHDVLDVPYKNMVYACMQDIEKLFDDANSFDDPVCQVRALILLCRMPVPECYFKSYAKGVELLYSICFDDQGNFVDTMHLIDIRLLFKDFCKKAPVSWQDIARIPDWRCYNKKLYGLYTDYCARTCNEYNEQLLEMTAVDHLQDFVYLRFLLEKNDSKIAHKIYEHQMLKLCKKTMREEDQASDK